MAQDQHEALKSAGAEVQRWTEIFGAGSTDFSVRYGFAFALFLRAQVEMDGDEVAGTKAIQDLVRAEELLKMTPLQSLNPSMSFLGQATSFQLAEMYGEKKQDAKAIAKLSEIVQKMTGASATEVLLRGAALLDLAKYQQSMGAPERIALLVEGQIDRMDSLVLGKGKVPALPAIKGISVGGISYERTQAKLADRLAQYRFTQAQNSSSSTERVELIRKAGIAYGRLQTFLMAVKDEQFSYSFPPESELKRMIRECAEYQPDDRLPRPPQFEP